MASVVTIGGSVAGLSTALLLARRGHSVTVVEQDGDGLPPHPDDAFADWERRGVPHLRGTHVFNTRGLGVLQSRAPDVVRQLKAVGAREVAIDPGGDPDLVRLDCRRTTYELLMRRTVLSEGAVRFLPGVEVTGLVASRKVGVPHVTGIRTQRGDTVAADLVVDTSGRRTPLAGWLAALAPAVETEIVDSGMTVHTRWYRIRHPGTSPEPPQLTVNLGYIACFLAPADNGTFSVTFGTFGHDPAFSQLRHLENFQAAVGSIPPVAAWVAPDVALPMEDRIRRLGKLPNSRRRFVIEGQPVAAGVVAVGDAAVCTNPRFGRGIALALVQAAALADLLESHEEPAALMRAFDEVTSRELQPWYHDAVAGDRIQARIAARVRAGEDLTAIGGIGDDEAVRFARALPSAVQRDPAVRTAFLRTWHLMQPPSHLAEDADIRERVEGTWRELERDPPAAPGPDYPRMCRLLAR